MWVSVREWNGKSERQHSRCNKSVMRFVDSSDCNLSDLNYRYQEKIAEYMEFPMTKRNRNTKVCYWEFTKSFESELSIICGILQKPVFCFFKIHESRPSFHRYTWIKCKSHVTAFQSTILVQCVFMNVFHYFFLDFGWCEYVSDCVFCRFDWLKLVRALLLYSRYVNWNTHRFWMKWKWSFWWN